MKVLNRTLLVLVLAVAVALLLAALSNTGWALSRNPLGMGEDYDNALQPLIKIAAAIGVMVSGTKLVQRSYRFATAKVRGRMPSRSARTSVS